MGFGWRWPCDGSDAKQLPVESNTLIEAVEGAVISFEVVMQRILAWQLALLVLLAGCGTRPVTPVVNVPQPTIEQPITPVKAVTP